MLNLYKVMFNFTTLTKLFIMKYVKSLLLSLFIISSFSIVSCDKEEDNNNQTNEPQWEMFVYGRPGCGLCTSFKDACDAEGLEYTFYDIDQDDTKKAEMWDKLNAAGMGGGSVTLPVVDVYVDGASNMFLNPSIEEVKNVMP
jgi:glutaredoxin